MVNEKNQNFDAFSESWFSLSQLLKYKVDFCNFNYKFIHLMSRLLKISTFSGKKVNV